VNKKTGERDWNRDKLFSELERGKNLLGVSNDRGEDLVLELRVLGKLAKSYLGSETGEEVKL